MKDVLKKIVWLAYPLLLYFVIMFAVELVMMMGFMALYMLRTMNDGGFDIAASMDYIYENIMLINLVGQIVCIPVMILIYYLDCKKRRAQGACTYAKVPVFLYLCIIPVAIGLCGGLNRLISLFPQELTDSYAELSESMFSADMWIQIASMVFGAGILEELLFRGITYRRLKSVLPQQTYAAVISAALFGVFHGNFVQFVYAFLLGLVLVYVYEKYKNLAAPVLLHMTANAMSVYLTSDNGNQLLPLWKPGPVYFIMLIIELVVAGLMLKVIDNEVNPGRIEKSH